MGETNRGNTGSFAAAERYCDGVRDSSPRADRFSRVSNSTYSLDKKEDKVTML